jgi:hypothetical protein
LTRRAKAKAARKAPLVKKPLLADPDARPAFDPTANLPKTPDGKVIAASNKVEPDPKSARNPRGAILDAFGKLGGTRWLVRLAKRYPKDFASLLAKAMPQDINLTGTVGYAPIQVPVEQRDAIPGQFTVVSESVIPAITADDEPDPFT